jgi:FkbM family methyltransferase
VGNYTRALAKAVGRRGRVLAVEPSPVVFEELIRSTWAARVAALNLAASSEPGWAQLSVPVDLRGNTQDQLATLEQRDHRLTRVVPVRRVRLDDLIGADRPVSLIKIDVEGHESDVLLGATETLDRHRPSLVIEIEQRHLVGRSVADVVSWLVDRRYACFGLRERALLPWSEFDVDRDQSQWVRAREPFGPTVLTDARRYVNNFAFIPAERTDSILARVRSRLGER